MATGHPVDRLGRTLPDSGWPSDRRAPGSLEFVRRFCNTTNLESGADRLDDAGDFDAWLSEQGHDTIGATAADRERLIEVRELVRAATVAHRDGESDNEPTTAIAARCASVSFRFGQRSDGVPMQTEAAPDTAEHVLAQVVLGIADAIADDTWNRLKACSHCRWVVYDTSKNRSVRWCSMSACGGRSKVRRHRERHRSV